MEEVVAGYVRCAAAGMLNAASDGNAMVLALRVLDLQGDLEAQGVEPVYIGGELEPEQALQLAADAAAAGSTLQQAVERLLFDLGNARACGG